jgi:acetylornithine deacetylase/succinyl-diaminopimelate desuccinylase-like protein
MTNAPDPAVRGYLAENAKGYFDELVEWLRIPSISGDPAHAVDVRRSAEWFAAALRHAGFPTVEVWETGDGAGHSAVFAEWPSDDPDAPAVVVYGHHDVQPIDPLELWESPPFEPTLVGEQLRGRGASDDKGQILFHPLAIRAHLAATGRSAPAVTIKLLVEGEEESGSPHFAALLRDRRDRLSCAAVVVTDTGIWDRDTPSVCTAMRGLTLAEIRFRGPATDLHSGSFGGAVPNPLTALVRVLAQLHDEHGRVTLPRFYDKVIPLTDRERELFARLPFDEAAWLATACSRAAAGEAGYSTLERVWARPTAEINGMWGGHIGAGSKTIVPSEAHAKMSFRLVADQEPADVQAAMREWLAARVPAGIDYDVKYESVGVRPCMTPLDHPALQAVTRALGRAFQSEVLYTREGGSGPEADLADILDAPVVFLGVALPDDQIHAPNEKADLPLLIKGAEAAAYLWPDLADALRRPAAELRPS